MIYTGTGVSQGCDLAPVMFIMYTNDCVSDYGSCPIIKYARHTVKLGKFSKNNTVEYLAQVNDFTIWCQSNFLDLGVQKKLFLF